MKDEGLKPRLVRRESWAYISGIAIGFLEAVVIAVLALTGDGTTVSEAGAVAAALTPLSAAFLGAGVTGQLKRGEQRGQEIARELAAHVPPPPVVTMSPISSGGTVTNSNIVTDQSDLEDGEENDLHDSQK